VIGAGGSRHVRTVHERGSATIWVLAACALVVLAGSIAMARTEAVLARHRAEAAADLAALAAAGRIGIGTDYCAAARRIASADGAELDRCVTALAAGGRSGTVTVRVRANVHLPVIGARAVTASAIAERASGIP
jgi:secretion/DNA translocation related TadE-like protein